MKKQYVFYLLAVSFLYASTVFASDGMFVFSGQIVNEQSAATLTTVIPETASDGSTQYVVYSNVTHEKIATFASSQAAETFVGSMSPSVAYRQ